MKAKESVGLKQMIEIMKCVRLLCSIQYIVTDSSQLT
jgi:hypothetical protein